MTKWADYCISAVHYNTDHQHIVRTKVYEDNGDTLGTEKEWMRSEVVSAIEIGKTFITIFRKDDKWAKGQEVRPITINGTKYIRTDANSRAADNLDNLPEY